MGLARGLCNRSLGRAAEGRALSTWQALRTRSRLARRSPGKAGSVLAPRPPASPPYPAISTCILYIASSVRTSSMASVPGERKGSPLRTCWTKWRISSL